MRVRTNFCYQEIMVLITTGTGSQKKLGMKNSNLFSCPSSFFFRKERNKEKAGKI